MIGDGRGRIDIVQQDTGRTLGMRGAFVHGAVACGPRSWHSGKALVESRELG
jgi:hypothetical protein